MIKNAGKTDMRLRQLFVAMILCVLGIGLLA
jgi:hypothetical protein